LNGKSNPVSNTAFKTTGSVPQVGPAAAAEGLAPALADAAGVAGVDGAVDTDGTTDAPGAQALATIATTATRIPGPRTNRRRVNGRSGLVLNIWILLLG
jgi:hypothetical protein